MVTDPSVHPGPIPVFMPDRSKRSGGPKPAIAYSGHRDHLDRSIVITPIGDRDRSGATLAGGR
jgi:hypothetical protein